MTFLFGVSRGVLRRSARLTTLAAMLAGLAAPVGGWGLGVLSASTAIVAVSTPAHANCLLNSAIRTDIADADCLEAQRTGCVRHMLTPAQYKSCLAANAAAKKAGKICIIGGQIRNEFDELDCEEAKATGCVRHMLTDAQYADCLSKQTNN